MSIGCGSGSDIMDAIDLMKEMIMECDDGEQGQSYTVQDFCRAFNLDDRYLITSALWELKMEGKMTSGTDKIMYREDGGAILFGSYQYRRQ